MNAWNCNFGGATGTAFATFGGQMVPLCNYVSPLAKKFVYQNKTTIHYPLRRHVFRLKVRTAAEIRANEVVKKYMAAKASGEFGHFAAVMTNNFEFDHMGCIIPKDEYEVKKFTSYMTTKKASTDFKNFKQLCFRQTFFNSMTHNYAGQREHVNWQLGRMSTDEEAIAYLWYSLAFMLATGTVFTAAYWWYKYSQQTEYLEI